MPIINSSREWIPDNPCEEILAWEDIEGLTATQLAARHKSLALAFPNHLPVEELVPFFPLLSLVVLDFPLAGDGRAFSQARALGLLPAFKARLRAGGALIPDQFDYVFSLGFDEISLSEEQANKLDKSQIKVLFHAPHWRYQMDAPDERSILHQRHPDV